MGSLSDSHVVDGHPSIKLNVTMTRGKDFGNREAAMVLRDMAEILLRDNESLGEILIVGDSTFRGYKVKATEIDALDESLLYRPSTVTPTPGEDDELEFTLVVAGIPSLKALCRVRATQTFGKKEAYEMIRAEGVKLVRPQAVDGIIVALDSSIPGYEVNGTETSLVGQIK